MTHKEKIIVCSVAGCLGILAILVIVCVASPKARLALFRMGKKCAHEGFFDRLKGVSYSKSDYDGIDVSKHQGVIKWDEVAQDKKIKFVYVRATMGKGHKDKQYDRNISEARKYGFKVGSYHFLTSKFSIDAQFRSFLSVAKPSRQDLIPMIDVEDKYIKKWSKEQLQDSVAKFCRLVEKHYGRKPMIYSNQHYYNEMLAPRFNDYYVYMANYRALPSMRGRNKHNIWQYSERGHIRGIGEYVDLSRFTNGTTLEDIEMN